MNLKNILFFYFLWLPLWGLCQIPSVDYAKAFGASGQNSLFDLHTLPGGENLIGGYYSANLTLGTTNLPNLGGSDGLITKTDAQGNFLWARSLSGPGNEIIRNITIDQQGDIIILGEFESGANFSGTQLSNDGEADGFLAKLNPDGGIIWVKSISNENYAGFNEVNVDANGNIYALGEFTNSISIGPTTLTTGTSKNILFVKFSPDGNPLWARTFGGTAQKAGNGLVVLPDGQAILTGYYVSVMQIGSTNHTNNGLADIFLAKFDTDGNPVWSRTMGGTGTDNGFALYTSSDGDIFLGGSFMNTMQVGTQTLTSNGQWDMFIAKFTAEGIPVWSTSFGGTSNDRLNDLLIDNQGNIYGFGWYQNTMAIGNESLTSLGEYDICLVQLNSLGIPQDALSFGGTSFDVASAMDQDASGNFYLGGHFFGGPFQVGNISVPQLNATNFFLVKLGNSPTEASKISRSFPNIQLFNDIQNQQLKIRIRNGGVIQFFSGTGQVLQEKTVSAGDILIPPVAKGQKLIFYQFSFSGGSSSGKIISP